MISRKLHLSKTDKIKTKKICYLSDVTLHDIDECEKTFKTMIDNKDYHKALIIKYVLYCIAKKYASKKYANSELVRRVKNAIWRVNSFESLFAFD